MMKFIASDLEAGKIKARRALGDNAHIVEVRELPSGDVEITASDKPSPATPAAARQEPAFAQEARIAIDESTQRQAAGAQLNKSIEQQFSTDALSRTAGALAGGKPQDEADADDALAQLLKPHRFSKRLLATLADGARKARINDDLIRLEAGFAHAFQFAPVTFSPTAPIMLVGPTGAGKTSCAAKLAAQITQTGARPFMLTADAGRAGAPEQIRTYAEALNADYVIIETPLDAVQAMRNVRPESGVILDTPGVSPYDAGDTAALKSYREAVDAEPVLVLPASGDVAEYIDWARAFKEIGVKRCILTKFDATRRVGAGLVAAFEAGLALSHFSETPFISEGLLPASADFLARRMIASQPGKIS